jgi:hypothetical protein
MYESRDGILQMKMDEELIELLKKRLGNFFMEI